MLTTDEFIKQSLALHLFFARIMKEHAFFLEAGFTPKNSGLAKQADAFRVQFENILSDVVALSNGVVNPNVLNSGEVTTQFTIKAERASTFFTGIPLQTSITQREERLAGSQAPVRAHGLENRVMNLNQRAIIAISGLILFKTKLLKDVNSCGVFTVNYPLLIDHILREAKFYLSMVQKLQRKEEIETQALEQERFWNRIMAEHAKFIRGLLDPTEEDLMIKANNFGIEFDALLKESMAVMDMTTRGSQLTRETEKATTDIRNFKAAGTEGLINCKIKSIILPLLGDHTLREANHYLRLLKMY